MMNLENVAECSCGCCSFVIGETKIVCSSCFKEYEFSFICKGICETKADDIVKIVNG